MQGFKGLKGSKSYILGSFRAAPKRPRGHVKRAFFSIEIGSVLAPGFFFNACQKGFKGPRVQGSKGSRVQGFKDSRVQGSKAPRVQGFKLQGCKGSKIQGFKPSSFQASKLPGFQASKHPASKPPSLQASQGPKLLKLLKPPRREFDVQLLCVKASVCRSFCV